MRLLPSERLAPWAGWSPKLRASLLGAVLVTCGRGELHLRVAVATSRTRSASCRYGPSRLDTGLVRCFPRDLAVDGGHRGRYLILRPVGPEPIRSSGRQHEVGAIGLGNGGDEFPHRVADGVALGPKSGDRESSSQSNPPAVDGAWTANSIDMPHTPAGGVSWL